MEYKKEAIRDLRERESMSLREFAKLLGTSPTTVSNWESGFAKPGLSYIALMCSRFNVKPGYFFDEN